MNERIAKPKSRKALSGLVGNSRSTVDAVGPGLADSPVQRAFNQQRDQMEKLLSALQTLENRLAPVLVASTLCCSEREECPSCGSSLLVAEIEQTTSRLEDYTYKVNTLISMLEI